MRLLFTLMHSRTGLCYEHCFECAEGGNSAQFIQIFFHSCLNPSFRVGDVWHVSCAIGSFLETHFASLTGQTTTQNLLVNKENLKETFPDTYNKSFKIEIILKWWSLRKRNFQWWVHSHGNMTLTAIIVNDDMGIRNRPRRVAHKFPPRRNCLPRSQFRRRPQRRLLQLLQDLNLLLLPLSTTVLWDPSSRSLVPPAAPNGALHKA